LNRYCLVVAALLSAAIPFCAAGAKTLNAGPGKPYANPSAAVAAAGPGDTIIVAPGQYFDCAVLSQDHLTIEGKGDPAGVVLTDKTCQGKALLIATGRDITIRNLTLTRARVNDGNGTGIRAEGAGTLTVDHVVFINNQGGILTNDNPDMTLVVRNSQFIKDGMCNGFCSHGIYAGHIAELDVENSIFRQTREGHDVKSRARRTVVTGCDMEDGPDGTASYLIEAPNGGSVLVRGNTMEKGPKSGNHTAAISIGVEGVDQPTQEITIEGNHFTNDGDYTTAFVNNVTATEAKLTGNTLSGSVVPLRGDGSSQ